MLFAGMVVAKLIVPLARLDSVVLAEPVTSPVRLIVITGLGFSSTFDQYNPASITPFVPEITSPALVASGIKVK